MDNFKIVHTTRPNIEKTSLPVINLTDRQLINICAKIKTNKALSSDGISPKIFEIARHRPCQDSHLLCQTCQRKLKIVRLFLTPDYWESPGGQRSMKCRLIPLNKVFPKTPSADQYRPIIVQSMPFKLIQRVIVASLKRWCKSNLRNQYGFAPGVSIETCKAHVIQHIV